MSKAFTKDDDGHEPAVVPSRRPLPEGAPNYVTPEGLADLRRELHARLVERSALDPAAPDRAPSLLVINAHVAALEDRIGSAVVVEPPAAPREEVRFGARVVVRGESGEDRTYAIVGVDEADAAHGKVAFVAPLARALLGKRVGDTVSVRTPRGDEELEVVAIE